MATREPDDRDRQEQGEVPPSGVPFDVASGVPSGVSAGFLPVVAGVVAGGLVGLMAVGMGLPLWAKVAAFAVPMIVATLALQRVLPGLVAALKRAIPSPERRAARLRRGVAAAVEAGEEAGPGEWPTVPKLAVAPAPGRTLPVLLPAEVEGSCCFLGCLIPFSLVWITPVSLMLRDVVRGHLGGKPSWLMTLFAVPFLIGTLVLIGVIIVVALKLIAGRLVGPITLEISGHPLTPGRRCRVHVEQPRGLTLRQVRVALTCEEAATYRQGTSTSTAREVVYREELPGDDGEPANTLAGGVDREFTLPADAMHSFESQNNKITWRLEVSGRGAGYIAWTARFPVIVHPAGVELPP